MYSILERLKAGIEEILRTRVFVLIIVFCIMSSILVGRLFNLQIVNGQQYLDDYKLQIQKTRVTQGTRGNIYDKNGKLLALSSKYLQGLFIGYISEIEVDSNNLTRSGYITPAVDFSNIQEVLVITSTKEDLTQNSSDSKGE